MNRTPYTRKMMLTNLRSKGMNVGWNWPRLIQCALWTSAALFAALAFWLLYIA